MPKFNPRRIKNIARITANTGISLLIFDLRLALTKPPKTEVKNIIGTVPSPKNVIKKVDLIISPKERALAKPT